MADSLETAAALARMAHSLNRRALKLSQESRRITAELEAMLDRLSETRPEGIPNDSNNRTELEAEAADAEGAADAEAELALSARG